MPMITQRAEPGDVSENECSQMCFAANNDLYWFRRNHTSPFRVRLALADELAPYQTDGRYVLVVLRPDGLLRFPLTQTDADAINAAGATITTTLDRVARR